MSAKPLEITSDPLCDCDLCNVIETDIDAYFEQKSYFKWKKQREIEEAYNGN